MWVVFVVLLSLRLSMSSPVAGRALQRTPGSTNLQCPYNNQSVELEITSPLHADDLLQYVHTSPFMLVNLYCCAVGYSYIRWYMNGEPLGPASYYTHEYNDDATREQLFMYSLNTSDCPKSPSKPFHTCIFTCQVFSANQQESVSHNISVMLLPRPIPRKQGARFLIAEADECINEGQNLHIHCKLQYSEEEKEGEKKPYYPRTMEVQIDGEILLDRIMDKTGRITKEYTNWLGNPVDFNVTIRNVTAEFINKTYSCISYDYQHVSHKFYVGQCSPNLTIARTEKREADESVHASIPIVVCMLVAMVAVILLVRFNTYTRMWCKVKILQRLQPQNANCRHDVYFIYKDVDHPTVLKSIQILEKEYSMSLYIPDRDSPVGVVNPQEISESLKASQVVVAFLSNDMFEANQRAHDWSDVSLSLTFALNRKVLMILLEDIDHRLLANRKDVLTAMKILKCAKNYTGDEEKLRKTFSEFYKMSAPSRKLTRDSDSVEKA